MRPNQVALHGPVGGGVAEQVVSGAGVTGSGAEMVGATGSMGPGAVGAAGKAVTGPSRCRPLGMYHCYPHRRLHHRCRRSALGKEDERLLDAMGSAWTHDWPEGHDPWRRAGGFDQVQAASEDGHDREHLVDGAVDV